MLDDDVAAKSIDLPLITTQQKAVHKCGFRVAMLSMINDCDRNVEWFRSHLEYFELHNTGLRVIINLTSTYPRTIISALICCHKSVSFQT